MLPYAAGVFAPVLVPVDSQLQPDAGRFVARCKQLLDEGCHGLVIFGTTGEANSFSVDQRQREYHARSRAGIEKLDLAY